LVFTEAVTTLILNTLLHWPTLKHRRTDNDLYWLLVEFIHRIRWHLPYVICEWTENIHWMEAYQLNSLISFQLYAVRRWRIYFCRYHHIIKVMVHLLVSLLYFSIFFFRWFSSSMVIFLILFSIFANIYLLKNNIKCPGHCLD
jgi:hypothetical protein